MMPPEKMKNRAGMLLDCKPSAAIRSVEILASHLYVAANWQCRDAVVGVAASEAKESRAHAERKDLDSHTRRSRRKKVAELVNEQQKADAKDSEKNREHG